VANEMMEAMKNETATYADGKPVKGMTANRSSRKA
jgi:hypothetical protein